MRFLLIPADLKFSDSTWFDTLVTPELLGEFSKCFYPDVLNVGPFFRGNALDSCGYSNAAFGKHSKQRVLGFFSQGPKAERCLACGADEAMNLNGKTIAVHGACESAYTAVESMLT